VNRTVSNLTVALSVLEVSAKVTAIATSRFAEELLSHPTVARAKTKYDRRQQTKVYGAQWKRELKGRR
jgi:hypothetical protein